MVPRPIASVAVPIARKSRAGEDEENSARSDERRKRALHSAGEMCRRHDRSSRNRNRPAAGLRTSSERVSRRSLNLRLRLILRLTEGRRSPSIGEWRNAAQGATEGPTATGARAATAERADGALLTPTAAQEAIGGRGRIAGPARTAAKGLRSPPANRPVPPRPRRATRTPCRPPRRSLRRTGSSRVPRGSAYCEGR